MQYVCVCVCVCARAHHVHVCVQICVRIDVQKRCAYKNVTVSTSSLSNGQTGFGELCRLNKTETTTCCLSTGEYF